MSVRQCWIIKRRYLYDTESRVIGVVVGSGRKAKARADAIQKRVDKVEENVFVTHDGPYPLLLLSSGER